MTLQNVHQRTKKLLSDFKCFCLKKHDFRFLHAFILVHEIHIIYKCKHCGKEEVRLKKD